MFETVGNEGGQLSNMIAINKPDRFPRLDLCLGAIIGERT